MDFFDSTPLVVLFAVTAMITAAAFEGGFRVGSSTRSKQDTKDRAPVGAIVAVVLSLASFILAFTFGIAAARFNDRRVLITEEANAIDTTFLRSDFLPDKNRDEVQNLLRQYVDVRLHLVKNLKSADDKNTIASAIGRSEKLQDRLWAQAREVGKSELDSDVIALFIESLNKTIDIQAKRITASLHARLPDHIWVILYLLVCLGMFGLGYHSGLSGGRNIPITATAVLSFAIVLMLIADLDRPIEGYLLASKQPIIDLGKKLGVSTD